MIKQYWFVLILVSGLLLSVGLFAACQTGGREATIVIISRDQSDTASLNPSRLRITADLALRSYQAGPHRAVRISHKLITYSGDESNGVAQAEQYLKKDRHVIALVGDIGSSGTRLVAELADRYKLPHLSFFATDDAIFEQYPWSFSYRSTLQQETAVLLDILLRHLSAQRLTVVKTSNASLNARLANLKSLMVGSGLEIVTEYEFGRDIHDFRSCIARHDWTGTDALLLFLSSAQTEHCLQQLNMGGITVPIVLSSISVPEAVLDELSSINLSMYSLMPSAQVRLDRLTDERFVPFKSLYPVAMGNNRFDSLGLWAYDGFLLLHEFLQQASSPEQVRQALSALLGNRMVGNIRFNSSGILEDSTFTAVRLEGGSFVELNP